MVIDAENENVRLDRYLKNNCKSNSLSEIFKAIRCGHVKVNGKKSKGNYRLNIGDNLEIIGLNFDKKQKEIKKIDDKLVFYEDENYLIIDKPKGVAMHKGSKNKKGLSEIYNLEFANRLDKKTSGLVIACKNKKTLRYVTSLIRENKVIKKYIAEVKNNGKYKVGDKFDIINKLKVIEDKVIVSNDGLYSESHFKVIEVNKDTIKLEVELITGRKHQIRVQLANIGLAIIGDDKYGDYKKEDELKLECFYIEFDKFRFNKKSPKAF